MKSTLPASLIGQWASYDFDTQLHLFPDASVLLDIGALGEVGVQATLTQDEDGTLRFTSAFLSGELRPVNDTLEGTCLYEEEKSHAVFKKIGEQPLPHAYHHAPFGEPIQVPDDFPLSAEQLTGSYRTQVPNLLYMSLAAVDGGVRLALSIDDSTAFQHRAAWCEDGALVWQVNDAFHRITCTLRPGENRSLCGSFTLPGQATGEEICFEKTSDTPSTWSIPEEKPDSVVLPENVSRLELLQRYAAYGSGEARPDYTYDTHTAMPESLRAELDQFGYSDMLRGKEGDALAFACLDFMGAHFHHNGNGGTGGGSLEQILHWSAKREYQTNCRGLSLMLAALLRYNGIRAAHVTCMPYENPFSDCHVVVDCFLPSGARVMMDPTYHLYLRSAQGGYVSLPELRRILLTEGELIPNEQVCYTGKVDYPFRIEEYRSYMTKNTLYFQRSLNSADGFDTDVPVYLFPLTYPSERVVCERNALVLTDEAAFW